MHEEKWSAGYFVKPIRNKVFTGKVISSINDLIGCGNCHGNYEVLVSEAINIKAEWRCFILYDEIIDVRPYGMLIDPKRKSYLYHYDKNVLQDMLSEFMNIENRPSACSMDICVTEEGKTLLMDLIPL
ncbi:MAG: ATP-grasp domain-containing protein [Lachnospiraceae bacterium]|nr:ATP-grasp domain-containing protein [Lachnospiraceae bacterium]MBR4082704.1 ATP-grasp domain-containing protein [Lachnospiraceae bacterium]